MDSWLVDYIMLDMSDPDTYDTRHDNPCGGGCCSSSSYLFDTIQFDGVIVAETEKAILINSTTFKSMSLWFPKSQLHEQTTIDDGLIRFGVPRWLYQKKESECEKNLVKEKQYTMLECFVMAQTSLAWLIKYNGVEFWVPISQMRLRKFDMKKSQWVMEVAEWVVTKALSESTKDNDPSYVNYSTLLKTLRSKRSSKL